MVGVVSSDAESDELDLDLALGADLVRAAAGADKAGTKSDGPEEASEKARSVDAVGDDARADGGASGETVGSLLSNAGAVLRVDSEMMAEVRGARESMQMTLHLPELQSYTFGTTEPSARAAVAEYGSLAAYRRSAAYRAHLRAKFEERGVRRCVAAVLLVHQHKFPHVLLLHDVAAASAVPDAWALPGGRLRPGESERDGLRRKLVRKLGGSTSSWDIGEQLMAWFSLSYGGECLKLYPYVPPHCTAPKERLSVFVVRLPPSGAFTVPRDLQLVAFPLFEVYNRADLYGPVIAAVPQVISCSHLNFLS